MSGELSYLTIFARQAYVGPPYFRAQKYTLAVSRAAPWWVTVNMPTGDRQTDARLLHYTLRYGRCCQRNLLQTNGCRISDQANWLGM